MSVFWPYHMDPEFLLCVVDYTTSGTKESIHWHDYLQLTLCLEGHGRFIFTNKEYEVSPGDLFIVSNFEHHVALADPGDHLRFLFIIFMPDFIAPPGSRQFDYEYLTPFWYDTRTYCNKISADEPMADQIGTTIRQMKQVWDQRPAGYRYELDSGLRSILSTLIRHQVSGSATDGLSMSSNHYKIREALQYINQNFLHSLTLEQVANEFHFSESWFRHCFKDTIRVGFKEYVTYLRLTEARKLLLTTNLNVSEVAGRSGFSNIHQFYKVFNKYVFMSPAEFRKKYSIPVQTN